MFSVFLMIVCVELWMHTNSKGAINFLFFLQVYVDAHKVLVVCLYQVWSDILVISAPVLSIPTDILVISAPILSMPVDILVISHFLQSTPNLRARSLIFES